MPEFITTPAFVIISLLLGISLLLTTLVSIRNPGTNHPSISGFTKRQTQLLAFFWWGIPLWISGGLVYVVWSDYRYRLGIKYRSNRLLKRLARYRKATRDFELPMLYGHTLAFSSHGGCSYTFYFWGRDGSRHVSVFNEYVQAIKAMELINTEIIKRELAEPTLIRLQLADIETRILNK